MFRFRLFFPFNSRTFNQKRRIAILENTTVAEGDVLEVFAVSGRQNGWILGIFVCCLEDGVPHVDL